MFLRSRGTNVGHCHGTTSLMFTMKVSAFSLRGATCSAVVWTVIFLCPGPSATSSSKTTRTLHQISKRQVPPLEHFALNHTSTWAYFVGSCCSPSFDFPLIYDDVFVESCVTVMTRDTHSSVKLDLLPHLLPVIPRPRPTRL